MTDRFAAICLIVFMMLPVPAAAQDTVRIVYLGVEDDPHYMPQPVYTGLSLKDRQRPVDGARLAMRGTRILTRALGLTFTLDEVLLPQGAAAGPAIAEAWDTGAVAIVLDLPEDMLADALDAIAEAPGAHFNIRHRSGRWRTDDCRPNLFHSLPSQAMLSDALSQHLRSHGWDRILLLSGTAEADSAEADSVRASAEKFGLQIVEDRSFELSNDPRNREKNNIALLTGGSRHDVVWIVDSDGEFGRYVPYATYAARPVVGSEGLTPRAWHWTYERHGAPQLNQRFRRSSERDMTSEDWAAWAAVRAVVESAQRLRSADPEAILKHLSAEDFQMDLYKGAPGSFRPWNGQLRQPILLATHNAVISVAPVEGFEHRTNALDTLGIDLPEDRCRQQ